MRIRIRTISRMVPILMTSSFIVGGHRLVQSPAIRQCGYEERLGEGRVPAAPNAVCAVAHTAECSLVGRARLPPPTSGFVPTACSKLHGGPLRDRRRLRSIDSPGASPAF